MIKVLKEKLINLDENYISSLVNYVRENNISLINFLNEVVNDFEKRLYSDIADGANPLQVKITEHKIHIINNYLKLQKTQ